MSIVMDTSVTLCWAFEDEDHPTATKAIEILQDGEAHVPSLWWFEVRNILVVNECRGRITEASSQAFLQKLNCLSIKIDHMPQETVLLGFARQYRLTVYDAAYLELAERKGMPLATLDTALRDAATKAGVELI